MPVTFRAYARTAPGTVAAELRRSADRIQNR